MKDLFNTTDAEWSKMASKLSENMTEKESRDFDGWLNSDPSNRELFDLTGNDWKMTEKIAPKRKFNVDKAWGNFAQKIEAELPEQKIEPQSPKVIHLNYLMRVAAILVVGLLVVYGSYSLLTKNAETLVASVATSETKNVKLPDASMVYLNKQSKIEYPEKFQSKLRNVKLDGEAFFEVQKDKTKPFVISTKTTQITVLGTSFNVNSNFDGNRVEVSVRTGKVRVVSGNNELILVAGEKGVIDGNGSLKKVLKNENYIAWRTKRIVCERQTVGEIIEVLNSVYGVQIEASSAEVANIPMGKTIFDNYPLETVLEGLCSGFGLNIQRSENKIILTQK
jgi:transmembrane sensor